MSNQSFLVCSCERTPYPSLRQAGFNAKQQIIACGEWMVPVFWLALFRERDLKACNIRVINHNGQRSIDSFIAPIVHRRFASARIALAVSILAKTLPEVTTWDLHGRLLLTAIEKAATKNPYLSIEWAQIETLRSAREFREEMRWLMRFFAGDSVRSPREKLARISDIQWGRNFPDPISNSGTDADDNNLAALLGSDYARSVPWWPEVSRTPQTRKSATATKWESAQPLETQLAESVAKRSPDSLRKLLHGTQSLAHKRFAPLLEQALVQQEYGQYSHIPEMLLKKGIAVSPKALSSAATEEATFAQFKKIMDRGEVNPARPSTTVRSKVKAPPIYWTAFDDDPKRAVKKVKLLLQSNVPVDVRDSTGDWLLNGCAQSPSRLRLILPLAGRKHKLAALKYVMERRIGPRASREEADRLTAQWVAFVRALHRSGVKEAKGCDAWLREAREQWRPQSLKPYPYRARK